MKRKYIFLTVILTLVLGLFAATTEPIMEVPECTNYIVEEQIHVERWMTKPFLEYAEEPLVLEEWMTKPFVIN